MSGHGKGGGKKASTIQADNQAWADQQHTQTACGLCGWTHTGTATDGRQQARKHRQEHHPEHCKRRRRGRALHRFTVSVDWERDEGNERAAEVALMLKRRDKEEAA